MKFHRLHKIPKENWQHTTARSTSNLDNPFMHDHHLIKKNPLFNPLVPGVC